MEDQIKQLEEKIEALEYRVYIMFLQNNALIKQLSESQTIDTDKLIKDMDELNEKLANVAEEEGSNLQEVSEGA